jgi:hypothetical protein
MKILLVVECTGSLNWYKTFEGVKIEGEPVRNDFVCWKNYELIFGTFWPPLDTN